MDAMPNYMQKRSCGSPGRAARSTLVLVLLDMKSAPPSGDSGARTARLGGCYADGWLIDFPRRQPIPADVTKVSLVRTRRTTMT